MAGWGESSCEDLHDVRMVFWYPLLPIGNADVKEIHRNTDEVGLLRFFEYSGFTEWLG